MPSAIHFGVDTLLSWKVSALQGQRVGLVTNNIATTAQLPRPLTPTRLALQRAGINLTKLFAPEHGLGANAADGAPIAYETDALTGLPVYSLYGATYRPTAEMLADLDLLLFDIPDVGVRFYTYIWTLSYVMEACAAVGLPLWVLDRPNPLGGELAAVEGPMLDEDQLASFVGRWSMPVRHSLTVGELATLWNNERALGVDLMVVPTTGWTRQQQWPAFGLPFVPTSPSMPDFDAAIVYPGTCFFEGTNLSEGRGTATPFRVVGAPWLQAQPVVDHFNAQELPGIAARAVQFTPLSSKYSGELCQGVMLHALDSRSIRPVAAGLQLLATIIALQPQEFMWLPYPTAANGPGYGHFDLLSGQLALREQIAMLDPATAGQTIRQWTAAPRWDQRVQSYLCYT